MFDTSEKNVGKFENFMRRYRYTNMTFLVTMTIMSCLSYFDFFEDSGFCFFMFFICWSFTLVIAVLYDSLFPNSSFDKIVYNIGFYIIGVTLILIGDKMEDIVTENNLNAAERRHRKAYYGDKNNQGATKADLLKAQREYYAQRSK